jgi:hypothetical protein
MANAAYNFQQFTDVDSPRFEYGCNSYLSESEHVYALVVFLQLQNASVESALPHLKSNLNKLFKKAENEISKTGMIKSLLAVKYEPAQSLT